MLLARSLVRIAFTFSSHTHWITLEPYRTETAGCVLYDDDDETVLH